MNTFFVGILVGLLVPGGTLILLCAYLLSKMREPKGGEKPDDHNWSA